MKSRILKKHELLIKKQWDLKAELDQIKTQLNQHQFANAVINDCLNQATKLIAAFEFQPSNLLSGCFYSLKDNIVTTDTFTTGGSFFLKDYCSPFNATVYDFLSEAGAINVAKANLDEFGLGGTGIYSSFGRVCNPYNPKHIIGGSSSGSCYLVASGILDFSIGTDTGDSVRKPASYAGVVGFKPSYGLISRYGVYPFCPSLDTVGIFSQYVADTAIVLSVIAKHDAHDATTYQTTPVDYLKALSENLKPDLKIAVLNETFVNYEAFAKWDAVAIKTEFENLMTNLKTTNYSVSVFNFNLNYLKIIESLYMIIAYAEATSCYSNLTGISFGPALSDKPTFSSVHDNRNLFGNEFKKRMVIGAFVLDVCNYERLYLKAKKIRTLILEETKKLFQEFDVVVLPGSISTAFLIEEVLQNQVNIENNIDKILQIANFCGLPSVTIPWIKIKGLPVGLNLFANFGNDALLLKVAYELETFLANHKQGN